MKYGTTKRQADCLVFCKQFIADNGISPTNDEIIEALGLRARSGAVRLLDGLEKRGHIKKMRGRTRSITIVPDNDDEIAELREIKNAALVFLARQKQWRESITAGAKADTSEQAAAVGEAFNRLAELVGVERGTQAGILIKG